MFFTLEQSEKDIVAGLVESLRAGACILFPCGAPWNWGLAVDATNDNAVEKLRSIKQTFNPQQGFVFVQDEIMHEKFICRIPETVKTYIRNQEDKQVAVMYNKIGIISKKLTNHNGEIITYLMPSIDRLGIQMSRHILRLFGKPIFACPAIINDDIENYPTSRETIDPVILQRVDQTVPITFESGGIWTLTTILKYNSDGTIRVVAEVY